ncbi:hypothetical protein EYC54_16700 [Xanthomonas oryzae]|nr:hypothetical protein EYC54_16700 [Xanthomonas oryzae]
MKYRYDLRDQVVEVAINDDASIAIARDALGRRVFKRNPTHTTSRGGARWCSDVAPMAAMARNRLRCAASVRRAGRIFAGERCADIFATLQASHRVGVGTLT